MCNSCKTACNCQTTPRIPVAGEVWVCKSVTNHTATIKLVDGEDIYYKSSGGGRYGIAIPAFLKSYNPLKPKPRELFIVKDNRELLNFDGSVKSMYNKEFAERYGIEDYIKFVEASE